MKIKYTLLMLILASVITISLSSSCESLLAEDRTPKKEMRCIFLFDRIDKSVLDGFSNFFYSKVDPNYSEITQRLPENLAAITFEVYNAANKSAIPLVVSFSELDNKEEKGNKATSFLNMLKKDTSRGSSSNSNFILKNMERIIGSLDDSSVIYKVAFFSRLVENSGDITEEGAHENAGKMGNFHFVSSSGSCIKEAIDAAEKQISDQNSWIYRHFVKTANANPLLRSIPIHLYTSNQLEARPDNNGYDGKSIDDLWDKLFAEMGLNVKRKGHGNLSRYNFFK